MIYDGKGYKDRLYKDDEFECIGWYMYMELQNAMIEDYKYSIHQEFKVGMNIVVHQSIW